MSFQILELRHIRVSTRVSLVTGTSPLGMGWPEWMDRNHLSTQIRTFCPFITCQCTPSNKISFSTSKMIQTHDAQFPCWVLRKEQCGKYLALSPKVHKESGSLNNLQHCLAKRASLKVLKFLKPIPLSCFGRSSTFFVTQ